MSVIKQTLETRKKISQSLVGRKLSDEWKEKIGKAVLGKNNGMWKGDSVGYNSLHRWVKKRIPKPNFCENCHVKKPNDLANKGVYDRNLENWWWLCRSCHMRIDGRLKNLKQYKN